VVEGEHGIFMEFADAHLADNIRIGTNIVVKVPHAACALVLEFDFGDKFSQAKYPFCGIKYHPFGRLFRLWQKSSATIIHRIGLIFASQSGQ